MQFRPTYLLFCVAVFWALTCVLDLQAQLADPDSGVTVSVRDEAGFAIVGAEVEASRADGTRRECWTDAQGSCNLAAQAGEIWQLRASASGFAPTLQETKKTGAEGVMLVLKPMGAHTSVDVQESANSLVSQSVSASKTADEIQALPIWLRDLNNLVALTPGATLPSTDDDRGQGISAFGSRTTFTNYTLDGIADRDNRRGGPTVSPNLESVQEVQVLTSSYSAEYGQAAGPQVALTTKSGGDSFHAKLFDYARDQIGFTVGGPLVQKKAHFFLSGFRDSSPQDDSATDPVPPPAWLAGNFRSDAQKVLDPVFGPSGFTRVPFPTPNAIPSGLMSPLAKQLLSFVPQSESGFVSGDDGDVFANQGLARFDYDPRASTKLYSRFAYQSDRYTLEPDATSVLVDDWPKVDDIGRSAVIGVQHTSRVLVAEAHLGVNQGSGIANGDCSGKASDSVQLMTTRGFGCPQVAIEGYPVIGDPGQGYTYNESTFFGDGQVATTRGKVTWKAGLVLLDDKFTQASLDQRNGTLTFSGIYSGNAVADFLLGLPSAATIDVGNPAVTLSRLEADLWTDATWTVSPRLLLEVGVRYEHLPGFTTETNGSTFSAATGAFLTFPAGSSLRSENPGPEPRFGFAYRVLGESDLVLRGGAGEFIGPDAFGFTTEQLDGNPPYSNAEMLAAGKLRPVLTDPALWQVNAASTMRGMDTTRAASYVYGYNLALEKSTLGGGVLSVGYIGSQGRHLDRRFNLNEPLPTGTLNAEGQPVLARAYPQYGDIIYQDAGAASNYNAGQLSWTSAQRSVLRCKVAYTFARSIDDASSADDTNWLTPQYPQDIRDLAAEKGLSDFQHKHELMAYGTVDLHALTERHWLSHSELGMSLVAMSGIPFTPRYGLDRPDIISNPFQNVPAGDYFNPAAFVRHQPTPQDPSYFGDLGRNSLIGPSSWQMNTSLNRGFRLRRVGVLEIRAEVFNVLNRMVGYPNFDLTRPTAGAFRHYQNEPRYFVAGASLSF